MPEIRYVHVEKVPAAVHTTVPVPTDRIPRQDFSFYDLSPQISFINEVIFPELQSIIDTYRIAAIPWMRYAISPISEALIDKAFIYFTDRENVCIGNIHSIFDTKSPFGVRESPLIQARFDQLIQKATIPEAENQMASAYYLYRMRRWTEAIALASAVVDNLLSELISQVASSEIEAEALRIAYGYRYKDLFNKVFPGLGKPKLSETDQPLWENFVAAKAVRGARVHGASSDPFDRTQEEETKRYLNAFHGVARWLSEQMGFDWELDCFDENDERLEAFP